MISCNTPKWIPKTGSDIIKLFNRSKEIEFELRLLAKKFSTDINLDLIDFFEFQQLIEESKRCFNESFDLQINLNKQIKTSSACKKLQRSPYKSLLQKKATIISDNLRKRHYQLIFIINRMVKSLFDISYQSEIILDSALILCNLYNEIVVSINKKDKSLLFGSKICSNTFPSLLLQPKIIDIGIILQIISKNRSEQCCTTLISCLLATCKLELSPNDDDSDTSSIQILKTLTAHMTSPTEKDKGNFIMHSCTRKQLNNTNNQNNENSNEIIIPNTITNETIINNPDTDDNPSNTINFNLNDPTITFFDNLANELFEKDKNKNDEQNFTTSIKDEILEHLIIDEEVFIEEIVTKCFKLCSNAFDDDTKLNEEDHEKWINRGIRSLWTQIGSTLDHIVLWWSDAPLCCRPPICTKQLREWLLLLTAEDAPEPILSTLKGLGETLTMYVTSTIWDQKFRLALVASSTCPEGFICSDVNVGSNLYLEQPGTSTGNLWCALLNTLSTLCNSCDQNGTIPNELPIVEQIPILHRLDHSIHTMRLWAIAKAKSLCSEWNMLIFFKIVHNDIQNCLEHLKYLRFPELVPADVLEVLIQVCVALRSKLISEIKVNIMKLKNTSGECIDILSSTCRTYTLATLSLCFPNGKEWKTNIQQEKSGEYVNYFLTQVYLPILKATSDIEILGLCLKIICESWLDHIYLKKIKFSRYGAINLLKDFDGVSEWIKISPYVPNEHVEKLSKHEVLRMCEGVGRILLRKPEDIISILPSPKCKRKESDEETEDNAQLPPEMFVPNQKRWLELRARSTRSRNCLCVCSGITVEN